MKRTEENGFTLVELAMVVVLFALVSTMVMASLKTYRYETLEAETALHLSMTESAILEFKSMEGRYPCPADPSLGPTDMNYGIEDCTIGLTQAAPSVDRDADGTVDNVLIGAVPFMTLLDPEGDGFAGTATFDGWTDDDADGIKDVLYTERMTLDGWKRKLTYAVSANQTNALTYNDTFGAISVVDEHNNNVLQLSDSAHFVVVAHGEDGFGAYTREGIKVSNCNPLYVPLPAPAPPLPPKTLNKDEQENCDGDSKFMNGIKINIEDSYNDDSIRVDLSNITDFWMKSGMSSVYNKNPGYVGIGMPDPQEQLHVGGNIRAEAVHSTQFCDEVGDNCMNTEAIAGNLAAMKCPNPNEVVVSIEDNHVNCAPAFAGPIVDTCPPGEFMTGISNITGVICAAP